MLRTLPVVMATPVRSHRRRAHRVPRTRIRNVTSASLALCYSRIDRRSANSYREWKGLLLSSSFFFFFFISLFYLFIVSVSPPCSVSVACNGQFDDTFSAVGGWVNENLTRERGWKVTMFPFRRVGMVDSTRSLMIRLLLSFSLGKKKSKFLIVEITTVPISIVTLRLSLHDFFLRLKECALDGVFHANYVT